MFYALLLSNRNIHYYSRVFAVCPLQFEGVGRNLPVPFVNKLIELQRREGLIPHHYTEVVFQSILHCYHMCESLTQPGCNQCHRKSDRYVLGNYYTALSFHEQGLSIEDSYSLFHAKIKTTTTTKAAFSFTL